MPVATRRTMVRFVAEYCDEHPGLAERVIAVAGGVAANRSLRAGLAEAA